MKSHLIHVHFFVILIVLTDNSTMATTLILQPRLEDGKDISLYERTDVELSSSKSLYAINTGPPGPGHDDFASLVQFDLANVTSGTVAEATLWLYENNAPTFSFQHVSSALPNMVLVQPAATEWQEGSVFYSTLPDALTGYDSTQVVNAVNEWFSWDVTAAVAGWLSGDMENNGLLITSSVEVRNGMLIVGSAFDASEQPNAPYLEIELVTSQPGDYDRDLDVDGADLLQWQRENGSVVLEHDGADGNGDGRIDAADLALWADNFGVGASQLTNVAATRPIAVPEPAAVIVAVGLFAALMRRGRTVATLALVVLGLNSAAPHAMAVTVPFTEEFSVDAANWRDSSNNPVSYVASGGAGRAGDGFVSIQRTFSATADPNFATTIFRGHDSFNSSADAFVGNWLGAGVSQFSFWIRHNAANDLSFGTRFATPLNSPGANALSSLGLIAPPNQWTRLTFPISPAAIAPEGPPAFFANVFSNVGNVQISVRPGASIGSTVRFDLDRVSIVPEPSTLAMLIVAAGALIFGTACRRQIGTRCIPIIVLSLIASSAYADEKKAMTRELTPLPEPLASFGAATLGEWLYVYGGHVGERHDHSREHVRGALLRQPLTGGPWEVLPGGPALQSPALVAHDGKLYRIGGLSARNASDQSPDLHSVATVDCYNPTTNAWSHIASLPQPRSSHDAVVIGDRVYVAGGWNHHGEEGEGEWLDGLLEINLSERHLKWREVSKTPFRRRALALAALGQKLYIIGGLTPETDFSRSVDIYDVESRTWSKGPDLPESDYNGFGASAFNIADRLFASSQSKELLALTQDKTQWEKAADVRPERFFHRLLPGPDGAVLLIGGANDEEGHLASITCWTPAK